MINTLLKRPLFANNGCGCWCIARTRREPRRVRRVRARVGNAAAPRPAARGGGARARTRLLQGDHSAPGDRRTRRPGRRCRHRPRGRRVRPGGPQARPQRLPHAALRAQIVPLPLLTVRCSPLASLNGPIESFGLLVQSKLYSILAMSMT